MIEIKGKVNSAICYATVVEDEAIDQIRRMCDHEFTAGSKIRIMPDVHAGKGCTIGTTMTITDKAVPNIVGVDIGCGMYTVELGKVDIDFEKVDAAAHYIPSGRAVWEGRMERFDLTGLCCYRNLKQAKRLERSLGTLGGGNHFIEIDAASDGTKYLVIHSGSRNLGKQVAEIYQTLAIDLNAGKADYFERRDELIRTYKEQGRRAEIQTALKAMEKEWAAKEPTTQSPMIIAKTAFQLFEKRYGWNNPIRSVTVQAINLVPQDTPRQIDMFMDAAKQDKLERMEKCVEEIRRRFGKDSITMTTGVIELKCPNCHRVVEVDLSLRKGTVKYRLTRSSNRANN